MMMRLVCWLIASPLLVQAAVRSRRLNYFKDAIVDGLETEYNEYATSWRLLGLYVDCQDIAQEERRRRLEDGNENGDDEAADEDGNDDGEEEEQEEQEEEQQEEDEQAAADDDQQQNQQRDCGRYLLWAAYVDVDYEGGGLSEYKIFDASKNKYDATGCNSGDSSRCVKMDCHSSGTNYKPLGYFRQDNPTEFLQLLANYQGSCSWDDDQYAAIMDAAWLPQGCTQLGDNGLFYDFKPIYGGAIDIGIYVDEHCSQEYTRNSVDVDALVSEQVGDNVDVSAQLKYINSALDTFKVCQPCRTYDFNNEYYNENEAQQDNADEEDEEAQNDDGANEDPNHFHFVCQDAAGNNGINMCEAFAQQTEISAATLSEVYVASSTGTIQRPFGGTDASATFLESWGFFLLSSLVFLAGIVCFCCVAVKRKKIEVNREPLVRRA